MIKAIIFDFFGVLVEDSCWMQIYQSAKDSDKPRLMEINSGVNLNKISWQEFCEQLAVIGNVSTEYVTEVYSNLKLNDELVNFISSDLKKYKKAVLSNASATFMRPALERYNLLDKFDDFILSSEVGFIKPDPQAFITVCKHINVMPEECIFIDDNISNIQAAQNLKIKAVQFTNNQSVFNKVMDLIND